MPNRINMDSAARIKGATAIAIYDEYSDAQRAVDYLSDREFPVEYCTIAVSYTHLTLPTNREV